MRSAADLTPDMAIVMKILLKTQTLTHEPTVAKRCHGHFIL